MEFRCEEDCDCITNTADGIAGEGLALTSVILEASEL